MAVCLFPNNYFMKHVTPLFSLWQVVATAWVAEALDTLHISAFDLISRHVHGDWSEMSEDSQAENALAVQEGYRILSAYTIHNIVFWIITEWDRSVTTILFPDEY